MRLHILQTLPTTRSEVVISEAHPKPQSPIAPHKSTDLVGSPHATSERSMPVTMRAMVIFSNCLSLHWRNMAKHSACPLTLTMLSPGRTAFGFDASFSKHCLFHASMAPPGNTFCTVKNGATPSGANSKPKPCSSASLGAREPTRWDLLDGTPREGREDPPSGPREWWSLLLFQTSNNSDTSVQRRLA